MDKLINAVKVILHPFLWVLIAIFSSIGKTFIAFRKKWLIVIKNKETEDIIVIGVLYTLFLMILAFVPFSFFIFIGLITVYIALSTVASIFSLVIGWLWLVDGTYY